MTPIKSLPTIKRSLEKAFTCKSHFMTMIHSEWCVLLFTCLLWHEPAIYFGVKRGGQQKQKKKNNKTRKEGDTQGSMGKRLCKSHLFLGFV